MEAPARGTSAVAVDTSAVEVDRPRRGGTAATNLGNNSDSVRRHNLSTVLGLVHSHGGMSRAQLTRATGLNRSTVALLVAELAQLGLVVESDPDPTNRIGRPSPIIHASTRVVALAINPDLDAIRVAVVSLGGQVLHTVKYDTVRVPGAQEMVNVVSAVFSTLRGTLAGDVRIVGVGVAVPGLVRATDGLVIDAPHLEWKDEPLCAMLVDTLGLPAYAANDAVIGASAQATFGQWREVRDLVYLYGGASGIGGGIISGGALLSGAAGFAGQLGHTHVRTDGARCGCGSSGCLEAEVTRQGLLDATGLGMHEADRLESVVLGLLRDEAGSGPVTTEVARQVELLAVGLKSVINLLNPSKVLFDGFLRVLLRAAESGLAGTVHGATIRGPRDDVELALASLDADPLLVGAAQLAFAPLIADPAGYAITRAS